jgi:hypothetical protein
MKAIKAMKHRPTRIALSLKLAALTALTTALGISQGAQASVSWDVSISTSAPAPSYTAPGVQVTPVPSHVPIAPQMPNIEQLQAQQQARIQWGVQVGLITPSEHHRLQQTQQYIEQQRRWAYADGWLTYDEHIGLIDLLNGAGQDIEHQLANWQKIQNTYYPMPPVLTYWNAPRNQHYGQHHRHRNHEQQYGHVKQGHGQQEHQHRDKSARIIVPLPPSPHQVLRQLRDRF